MSVQCKHGSVRLKRAFEPGAAKERKDRFGFADDCLFYRGLVGNADLLLRVRLGQPVVELDGLAFCDLDEGLDSLLAEGH